MFPQFYSEVDSMETTMATSSSTEPTQQTSSDELLTLADLAGIKGPGNTMKTVIELAMLGVSPQKIQVLLRDILANKNRSRRVSSKHSSRRTNTSSAAVEETSTPQP